MLMIWSVKLLMLKARSACFEIELACVDVLVVQGDAASKPAQPASDAEIAPVLFIPHLRQAQL